MLFGFCTGQTFSEKISEVFSLPEFFFSWVIDMSDSAVIIQTFSACAVDLLGRIS